MGSVVYADIKKFQIAHHVDCGVALMRCNRFLQAKIEYEAVLSLDPVDRYARWGRSLANLSLGNYKDGMEEHDWAWEIYDWRALGPVKGNVDRILALPEWKGEPRHLILYHEMGFGDAIMCLRFLPDLVRRNKSVTLVVRPELVSLMEECKSGAVIVGAVPGQMGGFEARATFFNAIWIAGWTDRIPTEPYIKREFKTKGNRMGVAWSGHSQTNFTAERFLSRLNTRDYLIHSLQPAPAPKNVVPLNPSSTFKITADLMAEMDVVVTVDTSVAHLAGAMGHQNAHVVIPYLRDWRWWHKDRWYPTLNIYPQDEAGDWDKVFDRVNEAIK